MFPSPIDESTTVGSRIVSPISVPALQPPSLFSLSPRDFGGRRALKGFQFQTRYITYVLAGWAAGREDFVNCRVEAVEDFDAVLAEEQGWVERYYQIKSKEEGTGQWTLIRLEQEAVLSRFFAHFQAFNAPGAHQKRKLELFFVVDGELDADLIELRAWAGNQSAQSRARLFALLVCQRAVSRDTGLARFQSKIRELCLKNASDLINRLQGGPAPKGLTEELRKLAEGSGLAAPFIEDAVIEAASEIFPMLDNFLETLRFESRLGTISEDAIMGRLLDSADLSPAEGHEALERLQRSIEDESTRPAPSVIDRFMLRKWLGVRERPLLQAKPNLAVNSIARNELLEAMSGELQKARSLLLYGIPKVGKSQFVSALIDHACSTDRYFWFTFTGDPADSDRLVRQLAVWAAGRTGAWQISDDLGTIILAPAQAFERLGKLAVNDSFIVLDDCHRVSISSPLELVLNLVSACWTSARLVLISERKLPGLAALGVRELPFQGLDLSESVAFATKLGVDLSDSVAQFFILAAQVGGHPVMLTAIAKELSSKPTPAEILSLSKRLPTIAFAESFISDLSNRMFFDLLRTPEQRAWVSRIASIKFPVTKELAMRLAAKQPGIQVTEGDWTYMKSLLLDENSSGRYSIPPLLQQIAGESTPEEERRTLSVTAARYIFRTAVASRNVDFWDYQYALVALLGAGRFDEAATRFVQSFPSMMNARAFSRFRILFTLMNDVNTQAKITEPTLRWMTQLFEVQIRLQDDEPLDLERVYRLVRRIRPYLTNAAPPHVRATFHLTIGFIKARTANDKEDYSEQTRFRIFAPLQSALREAVGSGDADFVVNVLQLYEDLYQAAVRPNVELLKEALLQLPTSSPLPVSTNALITLYARYVSGKDHNPEATELLERHALAFRAAGLNEAYFACEFAAAIILHDGMSSYGQARERIERILSQSAELKISQQAIDRGVEFIADTFWAQSNYARSAEYYRKVIDSDLGSPGLHQIVCLRLSDSLIFLRDYGEAALVSIRDLRQRHSTQSSEQKVQLYGRIAWAYAEAGRLTKAAIACQAMTRIANSDGGDEIDALANIVASWVLGRFKYSDPAIPASTVRIRDSNALSDAIPAEEVRKARAMDPLRTKGMLIVATLFELQGHWSRSESFYLRALSRVVASETADPRMARFAEYVCFLHLSRVHIAKKGLALAAHELKEAHERALAEPSQLGRSDTGTCFVFNKGTPKVSTTF